MQRGVFLLRCTSKIETGLLLFDPFHLWQLSSQSSHMTTFISICKLSNKARPHRLTLHIIRTASSFLHLEAGVRLSLLRQEPAETLLGHMRRRGGHVCARSVELPPVETCKNWTIRSASIVESRACTHASKCFIHSQMHFMPTDVLLYFFS